MRGEYKRTVVASLLSVGSPPLARGIPFPIVWNVWTCGITPACAGNTILHRHCLPRLWDHPRLRGEYAYAEAEGICGQGSPPLARGIPLITADLIVHVGITPACAGNTRIEIASALHKRDHPRLRGEYPEKMGNSALLEGSPPLARGIRALWGFCGLPHGITPACAGNTVTAVKRSSRTQDHPRLRGEYVKFTYIPKYAKGSPPLARGIH